MANTSDVSSLNSTVGGKYRLHSKIGRVPYGHVYFAVDITNGEEVAVKMKKKNIDNLRLSFENKVYKVLQGGCDGLIPHVKWFGEETDYNVLVMDLLGPNLEELFNLCSRRFTMKTVLMLADQMIGLIQYVHNKSFIHRSIKPENFLMGFGRHCDMVYMIHFAQAKKYSECRAHNRHIPYKEYEKCPIGTLRFASINSLLGREQSRRDDMESLGYVLVYFNRGNLPWQGITATTIQQKHEKICEMKMSISVEVLCEGFPAEFATYINYCRGLRFKQKPDYMYLRGLFSTLFRTLNYENDDFFDWKMLKQKTDTVSKSSQTDKKDSDKHVIIEL